MDHKNTPVRRACAVGTTITLIGLSAGLGVFGAGAASADEVSSAVANQDSTASSASAPAATTAPGAAATDSPAAAESPAASPTVVASAAATAPASGATTTTTAPSSPSASPSPSPSASATAPSTAPRSTSSPAVRAAATYFAGNVTIEGSTRVGDTVTAALEGWPDDSTYTYQWFVGGTAVTGATDTTYTIGAGDFFSQISVTVTGTNGDGSGTRTAEAAMPVQSAGAPAFAEDEHVVAGVAGQPISYRVEATSTDPSTITYSTDMVNYDLPEGLTFDDGLISGTTTASGSTSFHVTASNDRGVASQVIEIDIEPGVTTGVAVDVYSDQEPEDADWYADSDGHHGDPVSATAGTTIALAGISHDEWGNETGEVGGESSLRSSNPGDVIVQGNAEAAAQVTFGAPGTRTLTYEADGYSVELPVTVTPVAVPTEAPRFSGSSPTITGAVGTPVSYTFHASGSPAPTYSMTSLRPLPAGLTFSPDGTLSGTTTEATSVTLLVTATNSAGSTTGSARLVITPGPAVSIETDVYPEYDITEFPHWFVRSDGTSGSPIIVPQGKGIAIQSMSVDRYGNAVDSTGPLTVSSDLSVDQIEGNGTPSVSVTFPHASTHTLRVTSGGVTNTVVVEVTAAAVAVQPTTIPTVALGTAAATRTTRTAADGSLAYTGSDDSGLLAWALGLVAAGAAVTVLRFRRRRAQR